jgi:hypothetical protein
MNLDPEWWRPRFIYPYALDPTPYKEGTVSPHQGNICSLDGYNFDMNLLYSGLKGGPKLSVQKLNVVDTQVLQYPVSFILPKVVDKRKLQKESSGGDELDMEDPKYQQRPSPRVRGILFETYEEELASPLTISVPEILEDLKKYVDKFPYHVIPHVTRTAEVNDIIHNYNNNGGKSAL